MRPLSAIKNLLVPKGRAPRCILAGAFKGLKLALDLSFQTQVYLGLAERETHRWIKRLSRGVASAVDIGAAEGEYALYFLAYTTAKRIYGFEPSEQSTAIFLSNLKLNGFAEDRRLSVSSLFVGDKNSPTMRTLDSLLSEIEPPLLVKIDVDGAEMDVLRGAQRMLADFPVRWIIETHTSELERECNQVLTNNGFKTRIVPNSWWRTIVPEQRFAAHFAEGHNRWLVAARSSDVNL
jgi:hypothetical protein